MYVFRLVGFRFSHGASHWFLDLGVARLDVHFRRGGEEIRWMSCLSLLVCIRHLRICIAGKPFIHHGLRVSFLLFVK